LPEPKDGWIEMSMKPGLGFEINRDRLKDVLARTSR
jgi:L-alanine-DL-glutamate epimerase-like enolase superfamily enzyme